MFSIQVILANVPADTSEIAFQQALAEIKSMLEGKQPLHFEKALFVSENAFYNNAYSYEEFSLTVEAHAYLIQRLIAANDRTDSLDFSTKMDFHQKVDITTLVYTEEEKKELYRKALANWAIFTYMTDTTYFYGFRHLPFSYQLNDPFGMNDWRNSQVLHLLLGNTRKANCFALTAWFKILSDRFRSDARICTAPQHIYIQHQDHRGDWYNVELATATHPGDGTIQTLTYTYKEAILNDIALRHLNDTQAVALCLVNLGKSYEHKHKTKASDFMLQCAELALLYDPNSLNAMLLKEQALEEKVIQYAVKHHIFDIEQLRKDKNISFTWNQLEKQIVQLYELGYCQMPLDMQKIILAEIKKDENTPLVVKNQTPDPFPELNNVSPEDKRYSTLSRGLFEEVHTPKPLEQYGRFILDTKQKKLVKIVSENNFHFLIDPVVFAWQIDPLAAKYPQWSPYAAFNDNPIIYIDPDGKEGIVVSGQPGGHTNKQHFLINGLNRALDAKKHTKRENEQITWLVYTDGSDEYGHDPQMLKEYKAKAEKLGINMIVVNSADEIIDYINEKSGGDSRKNDKISSFYYIGHSTPEDLDVGYGPLLGEDFDPSDLESDAFESGAYINIVGGCRTAVDGWFESSVVDQFTEILDKKSNIYGSDVRVNYPGGVVNDKQLVKENNGNIIHKKGKLPEKQ